MRFELILSLLLIGALAHPELIREKRDTTDNDSLLIDESSGASGEDLIEARSGQESSGDGSGEESSGEGSGEGSGEEVIIDHVTLQQLQTLNTYAQQVQAESQKLIHQANLAITEMTALSSNAQSLGILSQIVATNSGTVLQNAQEALNSTNPSGPNAPSTCVSSSVCYNDSGCGNGKCIGALAGTCNCNACIYGWPCQEDSACGGFNGACNTVTATCDCFAAYSHNNFTLTEALTSFCNTAQCDGTHNTQDCFGLPCNYGFCVC